MVTVAIIGVTAGVAVSSARTNSSRSQRFFAQINTEMTRVRTQAIASGREYAVVFTPTQVQVKWQDSGTGTGTYTLERTYNAPAGVEIYGLRDSDTEGDNPPVPNTFTTKTLLFSTSGGVEDADTTTSGLSSVGRIYVFFACTTLLDGQPEGKYAFGITALTGKTIGSRW